LLVSLLYSICIPQQILLPGSELDQCSTLGCSENRRRRPGLIGSVIIYSFGDNILKAAATLARAKLKVCLGLLTIMALPSPTSRRKTKVYVSMWDVSWALVSPVLALWLGGALVLAQQDWSMTIAYCALSSGFAVVAFIAFRLQDTMTRHFSAHEVLDIAKLYCSRVLTYGFLFTLTRLEDSSLSANLSRPAARRQAHLRSYPDALGAKRARERLPVTQ
jgi:hypothetical protein